MTDTPPGQFRLRRSAPQPGIFKPAWIFMFFNCCPRGRHYRHRMGRRPLLPRLRWRHLQQLPGPPLAQISETPTQGPSLRTFGDHNMIRKDDRRAPQATPERNRSTWITAGRAAGPAILNSAGITISIARYPASLSSQINGRQKVVWITSRCSTRSSSLK